MEFVHQQQRSKQHPRSGRRRKDTKPTRVGALVLEAIDTTRTSGKRVQKQPLRHKQSSPPSPLFCYQNHTWGSPGNGQTDKVVFRRIHRDNGTTLSAWLRENRDTSPQAVMHKRICGTGAITGGATTEMGITVKQWQGPHKMKMATQMQVIERIELLYLRWKEGSDMQIHREDATAARAHRRCEIMRQPATTYCSDAVLGTAPQQHRAVAMRWPGVHPPRGG
ncbi:hypothetical protein BX070DRAFT_1046 [Coemansia spiralis]|nr:hypothetical protein BX070DRAFT_1046 [Coemansia spiralis]